MQPQRYEHYVFPLLFYRIDCVCSVTAQKKTSSSDTLETKYLQKHGRRSGPCALRALNKSLRISISST